MTFDGDSNRWVVHLRDEKRGFHCGEFFLLRISEKMEVACRIEWGRNWYVIMEDVRFDLRESDTYYVIF